MAGINYTDEREYAPKLTFKNNEVLDSVSGSVTCHSCTYSFTTYFMKYEYGIELDKDVQCPDCGSEFMTTAEQCGLV